MSRAARKLSFALVPLVFVLLGAELLLRVMWAPEGEIPSTPEGFYLWHRGRSLGPWFLMEEDPDGRTWARSNPTHVQRGFHQLRVELRSPEERRMWAIGGSTTYSVPFEREGGFPTRLERRLGDPWRVYNAGVAGMDSAEFPGLVTELTELGGEGLIIYAGNNELRGAASEACIGAWRLTTARASEQVRMLQALRWLVRKGEPEELDLNQLITDQGICRRQMMEDQRALLQPLEELNDPRWPMRSDPGYQEILDRFERNLTQAIDLAEAAGWHIWLAVPPINLREPPSFRGAPPGLSADNRDRYRASVADEDWELALAWAPTDALSNYQRGMALEAQGALEPARKHLRIAADQDWQSSRITPGLQDRIRLLCKTRSSVTCVDIEQAFDQAAGGGIPGDELFVDFCHPTRDLGLDTIAAAMAAAIAPDEQP